MKTTKISTGTYHVTENGTTYRVVNTENGWTVSEGTDHTTDTWWETLPTFRDAKEWVADHEGATA